MLQIKNVKVSYYSQQATTLNFSFNQGVTLILGEVGSFKTTLFRIIGGIKEISDGEIVIDGRNIEELEPKKRSVALVGADTVPTQDEVRKALALPLRLRGETKKAALSTADKVAGQFNLDPYSKFTLLSSSQKISFFGARLALRPTEITMFDEPYHFFGESNDQQITNLINSRGGYVIVSSCDGEDVRRLNPDYIVVVRGDRILQQGLASDVVSLPNDKYVQMLIDT